MKLNVRRRSVSSRAFLFLILLGVCFISVVTYTATFADGWHGWGNGGFPWSTMHGQGCGSASGSGNSQSCNPFANAWQTCTSTTDQGTPVQNGSSGTPSNSNSWQGWQGQNNGSGGTPTNNWQGWHNCGGTPGQNNGTPVSGPPACTTTNQTTITQTPVATVDPSQTQTPVIPVTSCPSPTSVLSPSSTPPPMPTGIPQTPVPSVVASPVSTPVSGNDPQAQAAQAVFAQINQERASMNLSALQWSTQLVQSAHNHNVALGQSNLTISQIFPPEGQPDNGYAHQLPGEPPLGTRISNTGLTWSLAAENVGFSGGGDPTSAATGLNTSMFNEQPPDDGHRQNILSANTLVGVDVFVDSQNRIWLTEDFAKPR